MVVETNRFARGLSVLVVLAVVATISADADAQQRRGWEGDGAGPTRRAPTRNTNPPYKVLRPQPVVVTPPPAVQPQRDQRRYRHHYYPGRPYGYGYQPGFGGYAYGPGGYRVNGVTGYAPPGYFYDPIDGFVPYSLGFPGYGYATTGVTGVFGTGVFGTGVGGVGVGGVGGGIGVGGFGGVPAAPIMRPPLAPPVAAARPPLRRSVLVDTRVEPNRALAPAEIELFNSSKRDIEVTLSHLVSPDQSQQFRIPAGASVKTLVDRDPGAQKISVYESVDALGNLVTKDVARDIRSEVLYEVTVHEWAVQSVAIDRTGKSPDVIEDINMQGRGIGRFSLPPGDRFRGGRIDVYGAAKAANNAGSVLPITSANPIETDNADKLERAIFDAQQKAMQDARRGR